jgi:hypothetical protein
MNAFVSAKKEDPVFAFLLSGGGSVFVVFNAKEITA